MPIYIILYSIYILYIEEEMGRRVGAMWGIGGLWEGDEEGKE